MPQVLVARGARQWTKPEELEHDAAKLEEKVRRNIRVLD
jgi:hypothetical protein